MEMHLINKTDEHWMALALTQAAQAMALGEVPVGAVAVLDGRVVALGHRGALEKRCGLAVTVGSNPTLSALIKGHRFRCPFFCNTVSHITAAIFPHVLTCCTLGEGY